MRSNGGRAPVKTLCILGTRPEAIKLAPVIRELRRAQASAGSQGPGPVVCVTGQHREMVDQMLSLFRIIPDYDLAVMRENQSLTQLASLLLARLEPILDSERPDWVLVQGDTTTVVAASLAAFYARVRVGHVEAGLRTWDKWQPFPEEVNRRVTGNTVIDALRWINESPPTRQVRELLGRCGVPADSTRDAGSAMKGGRGLRDAAEPWRRERAPRIILITAHRRENFGMALENICWALRDLARRCANELRIVYPVHLNPNVWGPAHELLAGVPNIILTPPLDYLAMMHLLRRCYLVLTDSGGLQEEAPGLGVPVLVLRDVTERPEGVEAGIVRVIGTDRARIVGETVRLLEDGDAYEQMSRAVNVYGDGYAASRIVAELLNEPARPSAEERLEGRLLGQAARAS
ncbi:MAG: UDP-N-acetylglucosamine 2-epimerase (non-hydrolyzing) [Gemmatimonadetes bacterium]|nr:MAG: UDP-N-acetylglucosamine 2-epimerase (non-hydrolyzing) [Gemmatimonadota bacterium]